MRTCANPACGKSLDDRRPQTRSCGGPCRAAASRARKAAKAAQGIDQPTSNETAPKRTHATPDRPAARTEHEVQSNAQLAVSVTTASGPTDEPGPVPRILLRERAQIVDAVVATVLAHRRRQADVAATARSLKRCDP